MSGVETVLTVYFENPFWVGIIERTYKGYLRVCKIHFGSSEPKDYEVFDFILNNWYDLEFSKRVRADKRKKRRINPKRLQREISRNMNHRGVGTKSQNAIQRQYDDNKKRNKKKAILNKRRAKRRKFLMNQNKRKQNRRGR